MKVIAIAAVTAGGKTTTVNELERQLSNVQTLHFDNYILPRPLEITIFNSRGNI